MAFRWKLVLLALAIINTVIFHLRYPQVDIITQMSGRAVLGARVHALISLVLWPAVIFAGRWIPYL